MSTDKADLVKQLGSWSVGTLAMVLLGWYLYVQNENAEKDRSLAIEILQQTLSEAKIQRAADMGARKLERDDRAVVTDRFLAQQAELINAQKAQNEILTKLKQSSIDIVSTVEKENKKLMDRMVKETQDANKGLIKMLATPKAERKEAVEELLPDE